MAEVGRIASGIVHELNNPVAVIGEISGWVGSVASDAEGLNEEDREEIRTSVRHIGEQTKRCRNITHQLLSFVRESKLATSSLDAHELLRETVNLLTPELKFTDVEIVYNFLEGPVFINSDKQLLEQVFVNFISNAVYAVKEKGGKRGRITLETFLDDAGDSPHGGNQHFRHGCRHFQKKSEKHLRIFLYYQTTRQRDGPGPSHQPQHHQEFRGEPFA